MEVQVTIKQINADFDQKYANQYNFGKESENNQKYRWSDTYRLSNDVSEHNVTSNVEYKFTGYKKNGEYFNYNIPNMKILKCLSSKNEIIEVAISTSLIEKSSCTNNKKTVRYYFFLKSNDSFMQPSDYVYIDLKDFPIDLIEKE